MTKELYGWIDFLCVGLTVLISVATILLFAIFANSVGSFQLSGVSTLLLLC